MSLAAVSLRLATEPYTKAAVMRFASGASASRSGSARPTVFCAMEQSSAKSGDFGSAWKCFCVPIRVTVTNPLCASRASSRCTAPEPPPASLISSVAKKLRSGWPNRKASTRCRVVENSASARLVAGGDTEVLAFMPILGILIPILGIFKFYRCRQPLNEGTNLRSQAVISSRVSQNFQFSFLVHFAQDRIHMIHHRILNQKLVTALVLGNRQFFEDHNRFMTQLKRQISNDCAHFSTTNRALHDFLLVFKSVFQWVWSG